MAKIQARNAITRIEGGARKTYLTGQEFTCSQEEAEALVKSGAGKEVETPKRGRPAKKKVEQPAEPAAEDEPSWAE